MGVLQYVVTTVLRFERAQRDHGFRTSRILCVCVCDHTLHTTGGGESLTREREKKTLLLLRVVSNVVGVLLLHNVVVIGACALSCPLALSAFGFRRAAGGGGRGQGGTAVGLVFTLGVLAWVAVMGSFPAFSSSAGLRSSSAAAPTPREPPLPPPASSAPGRTVGGGLPAVHAPGLDTPAAANAGGGDRAAVSLATRNGADANGVSAGGAPDYLDRPRLEIEPEAADAAGPYDRFPGSPGDGRDKGVRDGGGGARGPFLWPEEELGDETLADGKARCWTDEAGNSRCLPTVFFFGVSKCGEFLG